MLDWPSGKAWQVSPEGSNPSLSRQGQQIAFESGGRIVHQSVDDSSTRRTLGSGIAPALSPDGERIAYRGANGIFVVSVQPGAVQEIVRGTELLAGPNWSPDAQELLYVAQTWKDWLNLSSTCPERSSVFIANVDRPMPILVGHACLPAAQLYRYQWLKDRDLCGS